MKNHHDGFVLIMVIVMISVLSLLVVEHLKIVWLLIKRQQVAQAYQVRMNHFEDVALQLVQRVRSLQRHSSCLTPNINDVATRRWLLKQGCVFENHYRYGLSDLGDAWLLTLLDSQYSHHLLQLRIGKEGIQTRPAGDGVMSWRSVLVRDEVSIHPFTMNP